MLQFYVNEVENRIMKNYKQKI